MSEDEGRKIKLPPFVSIQLLFSRAQNFSALLLHTSNFRRGGAHLFRLARVHFAPLGDDFSARVVQFDVPADLRVETARWLRIPIPHRIAIKVRLELYFDVGAKLLLISEIRSESEPASKRLHTVVDEHNSILPAKSDIFTVEHAEEDEQKRWLERSCLLIAIICSVVLLSCVLLCFCFFLLFRFRRPRKLKQHSPRSPTTLSSTSCSSDQSNSALLQLLLKSARRTMETARIPHKKIPPNHFFRPKTKMPREREEGKELMDIAKLVIEHNGGNRALISRSVEEESDEYADPEEPTKNASEKRSFVACRPANIHFASGEAAMMRRALLRNLPSSEYSLSSFAGNESIHSVVDSSRYRCTPTMSQFSPFPPPLPTMPPPPRRRQ
uniref:Discoidin domain-containing protein n=1 Tax=Globodera pallida TaxID=36090 RepID=A0A183BTZ9_GLOPA